MAVYTRVDENDLTAFLNTYDIGEATSFSGITEGVENSNYRLITTKGAFILTLYEKRVRTEDLPFFIGLMAHMAKPGSPARSRWPTGMDRCSKSSTAKPLRS